MAQIETPPEKPQSERTRGGSDEAAPPRGKAQGGGFFTQYKPEQGRAIRAGTFVGAGLLIVWGGFFVNRYLAVYGEEGSEWWRQLISPGIPLGFVVVVGAIVWRITFATRKTGDFMIATEGEMKKVSWSTKREVIGSTKVVIAFTLLTALLLFCVDLFFQTLFSWIGVLRV